MCETWRPCGCQPWLGQSLWRGGRLLSCFARVPKPRARRTCLFSIDRGEQLFHGTCGRRPERLVEADRLRELLPDEFVASREFAILCNRLLDTLGIATIQRPGRVLWQQSLDLVALSLFVDHVQCQLARSFRPAQLCYRLSASNVRLNKLSASRLDCLPAPGS